MKKDTQIKPSISEWQEPAGIWNIVFLAIFFANVVSGLGMTMSNSMLSLYADSLGAPASQIGTLMGMFAITALIFRFVAGPAIDSFTRKYLLMGSMTISAMAFIGYSISKDISSLMIFRMLQGVGTAFGNACNLAMVADALPRSKFNTGMGYYSLAQVFSRAIGPTVGLWLASVCGYSKAYLLCAAVMLLAAAVAFRIQLPVRPRKPFKLKLHSIIAKEALVPTAITFCVAIGFTTLNAFLIVFAKNRGVVNGIGLFFTINALSMLVTRPAIGKLTDRLGFAKVGIPALMMTALSFLIISGATSLWVFLVAAFVNSFGYGAVQPAMNSLVMKSVPPERRGSASSTNLIGMDSATIIGPVIAGNVAQAFGYSSMWIIMTIPILAGVLVVILFKYKISEIEKRFAAKTEEAAEGSL